MLTCNTSAEQHEHWLDVRPSAAKANDHKPKPVGLSFERVTEPDRAIEFIQLSVHLTLMEVKALQNEQKRYEEMKFEMKDILLRA